ncbi:MAG: hypothetical protein ACRDIB_12865, partial [Ardenticatenaceae bacterium]
LGAGRLPEWNPTIFGGVPFLADSQAQLFYPLSWPFRWLEAPDALAWSVALHLGVLATGTYAWARYGLGLGVWGAWLAGTLFALSGYLGAQVEHVNQVAAAAWLPWLLLGYERARAAGRGEGGRRESWLIRRRFARPNSPLLGLALAMSFLAGHAQTTFISLAMLGLWALRDVLRFYGRARAGNQSLHRSLIPNLLSLLVIGLLGVLLAAIQLLPTQALSALSPRAGGLTFREATSFSLDPRLLPRALLPTFGQDAPLLSEYVAWVGFTGLALAAVGALQRKIATPAREFGLIAAAAGLLLAFGRYSPLFWVAWRLVPGFDLFRAPARWLLLWAFGISV